MSITKQCLPGMNLGYTENYTDQSGTLRARTTWMRCERVDHQIGAVFGRNLHTDEEVQVHIDLIHTSNSPYQMT